MNLYPVASIVVRENVGGTAPEQDTATITVRGLVTGAWPERLRILPLYKRRFVEFLKSLVGVDKIVNSNDGDVVVVVRQRFISTVHRRIRSRILAVEREFNR